MHSLYLVAGLVALAYSAPVPTRIFITTSTSKITTTTSSKMDAAALDAVLRADGTLPTSEEIRHFMDESLNKLMEFARQMRESPDALSSAPRIKVDLENMRPSRVLRLPLPLSSDYLLSMAEKNGDVEDDDDVQDEERHLAQVAKEEEREEEQSSVAGCTRSSYQPGFLLSVWTWFRSLHFLVQMVIGYVVFAFICSNIGGRMPGASRLMDEYPAFARQQDEKVAANIGGDKGPGRSKDDVEAEQGSEK